jgi:glycosyltransferase involved in cell wall biosynthesis
MRITFVSSGLDTGGAEIMLLKLLQRLGVEFSPQVVSLTTMGEIGPRIADLGIPVIALGLRRGVPDPRAFLRLSRCLRQFRPDVVQTWMYHADLLGGVAARMAGNSKVVWGLRNSTLDAASTPVLTRLTALACAGLSRWVPDRIVSCSTEAKRIHVARGYDEKRFVVIPNGFDLDRFRPDSNARQDVRAELGVAADTLLVGLIGRFDAQKNHRGFVAAAGRLHHRFPHVHFLLAGRGVDSSNRDLMQAIRLEGLASVIHLLGQRTDVPRLMAALDILVSSSTHGEAFPNVVAEAMACGVPGVVTNVGDSAHIVGDTGRICEPGDIKGLADAMAELIALPAAERQALGNVARARIAANFEIQGVVSAYAKLYRELTNA